MNLAPPGTSWHIAAGRQGAGHLHFAAALRAQYLYTFLQLCMNALSNPYARRRYVQQRPPLSFRASWRTPSMYGTCSTRRSVHQAYVPCAGWGQSSGQ